jgi:hypothetical protein
VNAIFISSIQNKQLNRYGNSKIQEAKAKQALSKLTKAGNTGGVFKKIRQFLPSSYK